MSKETVKQYIRNQYTGKEQCQFLPQMNQQDSLAHSSLKRGMMPSVIRMRYTRILIPFPM